MQIVCELQPAKLVLKKAVLFYGRNGGQSGAAEVEHATIHPVSRAADGSPEIMPGELLMQETLDALIAGVAKSNGRKAWSWVTPEVLASGPGFVAWYTASQVRHVYFYDMKGLRSGRAPQPAMLWVRKGDDLYVFALGKDDRPLQTDPVFNSPHFNVHFGGKVCQGNGIRAKLEDLQGTMEAFWLSRFSMRHDPDKWRQTTHPKGLKGLWKMLLSSKDLACFPVKDLEPADKSVGELLNLLGAADE